MAIGKNKCVATSSWYLVHFISAACLAALPALIISIIIIIIIIIIFIFKFFYLFLFLLLLLLL